MSIINDNLSKVLGLRPVVRVDARLAVHRAAAFDAVFPDKIMPPKSHETNIASYLYGRRYHPNSIREVLNHVERCGTVECSDVLIFDARDRAAVESMLPDAPAGEWDRFPGRVELVEAGYEA